MILAFASVIKQFWLPPDIVCSHVYEVKPLYISFTLGPEIPVLFVGVSSFEGLKMYCGKV